MRLTLRKASDKFKHLFERVAMCSTFCRAPANGLPSENCQYLVVG